MPYSLNASPSMSIFICIMLTIIMGICTWNRRAVFHLSIHSWNLISQCLLQLLTNPLFTTALPFWFLHSLPKSFRLQYYFLSITVTFLLQVLCPNSVLSMALFFPWNEIQVFIIPSYMVPVYRVVSTNFSTYWMHSKPNYPRWTQ